jgi:PEP-CTERM motif-containing protein
MRILALTAATVLSLSLGMSASASALTMTLHGTGFDSAGNPLTSTSNSGGVDASWSIPAGSPGPGIPGTQAFFIGSNNADFFLGGPPYFPNSNAATFSGSGWISNNATSSFNGAAPYTFSMTFNLSSFDVTTVSITGLWSIADSGVLLINGHQVASLDVSTSPWGTLHSFTITDTGADAGFLNAGLNTISLEVTSSDNFFEAARFEGTATGSAAGVPEPSSIVLLGCGLTGIAWAARRSHRRK